MTSTLSGSAQGYRLKKQRTYGGDNRCHSKGGRIQMPTRVRPSEDRSMETSNNSICREASKEVYNISRLSK